MIAGSCSATGFISSVESFSLCVRTPGVIATTVAESPRAVWMPSVPAKCVEVVGMGNDAQEAKLWLCHRWVTSCLPTDSLVQIGLLHPLRDRVEGCSIRRTTITICTFSTGAAIPLL